MKVSSAKAKIFKSRSNAQDGHEAIRPSMPSLTPDSVKASLTSDQYKLYKLIWNRFTASQMADCIQKTTQADIVANGYTFKRRDTESILKALQHSMWKARMLKKKRLHSSHHLKKI